MNTAYLMIVKYSGFFYAGKEPGCYIHEVDSPDIRPTIAEAIPAFFEDMTVDPLEAALNPKRFFILTMRHDPDMGHYLVEKMTRLDKIDPALLVASV